MSTQPQNLILSPFSLHPLSLFPSSLSSHLNLSLYPFRSFHPSHPRWTWKAIFSSPEGPEPYDIWTLVSDGWWFRTLYNSCLLTCGCTHKDMITATRSLSCLLGVYDSVDLAKSKIMTLGIWTHDLWSWWHGRSHLATLHVIVSIVKTYINQIPISAPKSF